MINHLRKLSTGEIQPKDDELGICAEIESFFSDSDSDEIMQLSKKWPEFSGDRHFPVPNKSRSAQKAFMFIDYLWGDDDYGDARRRLCAWLADELEKEQDQ